MWSRYDADAARCGEAMRVKTILIALAFSVAALAQQHSHKDSPSLSETVAWMNQTLNGGHRGLFQQWDRQGTLMYEYTNDFAIKQCQMEIDWRQPFGNTGHTTEMWTQSDISTFSLSDIDPTTVKVVPFSNQYMTNCTDRDEVRALNLDCNPQAEVQFLTRNEAPAIKYKRHTVFPKLTGKDHDLDSEGDESHAALGMWDLAYARRFGKAFRHAVELCGGKPSAF
jgi:hypothetical protein